MLNIVTGKWWILLIRGIAAIVFGLLAILWPGVTLQTLLLFVGIYFLIDGVSTLFSGIAHRKEARHWWTAAIEGLAGIGFGLIVLITPQLSALVLLFMIGGWAVITGVFEVYAAIQLRKEMEGEIWLVLGGLLSLLFGIFVFIRPGAGALALIWLIAGYAIAFGVILIILALEVRNLHKSVPVSA